MKQSTNKTTVGVNELWQLSFLVVLSVALVLFPEMGFAAIVNSVPGNAICEISDSFTGEVATGVGTIAICTVGTMACLGRIQWTTAVLCAVGVALLFGTGAILSALALAGGNSTMVPCT